MSCFYINDRLLYSVTVTYKVLTRHSKQKLLIYKMPTLAKAFRLASLYFPLTPDCYALVNNVLRLIRRKSINYYPPRQVCLATVRWIFNICSHQSRRSVSLWVQFTVLSNQEAESSCLDSSQAKYFNFSIISSLCVPVWVYNAAVCSFNKLGSRVNTRTLRLLNLIMGNY